MSETIGTETPEASSGTTELVASPETSSRRTRPGRDGAGRRPLAMRPLIPLMVAAAAALVLIGSIALVPVTTLSPGGAEPAAGRDRVAEAVPSRIEVTQVGPGRVAIAEPRLAFPEIFSAERHIISTGPFVLDPATGHYVADRPGSLVIEGTFGDLAVDLVGTAEPATVTIRRSGVGDTVVREITASPAGGARSAVQVPSPVSTLVSHSPYLFRGREGPAGTQVAVGGTILEGSSEAPATYSRAELAWPATQHALRGWLVLVGAVGVAALAWLVGTVILGFAAGSGSGRFATAAVAGRGPPAAVGLALGFGLWVSVVNTLAYVVPMTTVVPVVLAAVAALGIAAAVPSGRAARATVAAAAPGAARALAYLAPVTVLSFFPVFAWGTRYAGAYRTDLFEYSSLSSILEDHSLLAMRTLEEAQQAGSLTSGAGFVWRSIDTAAASFLSTAGGLSTVGGFVVLAVVLFVCFGVGVLALASRASRWGRLIAAVALLNPLLLALFDEGYLSQYFFVALVPLLIVTAGSAVAARPVDRPIGITWAVAATAAAMISSYPYFFVLVGLAVLVPVLLSRPARDQLRRVIVPVSAQTVLLVNVALVTVVRARETLVHEERLDEIARFVLLSGWDWADITEMFVGLRSYTFRIDPLETAYLGGGLPAVVRIAGEAVNPGGMSVLLAGAALVALVAAVDPRRTLGALSARIVLTVVATWVASGLAYAIVDRPYPFLKGTWVAAALVPLVVAVARWRPRWSGVAVGGVAVLALLWTTTLVAQRLHWVLPLWGSVDRAAAASAAPDLALIDGALDQVSPHRVALVRGEQPLAGSDRDRVLTAFTMAALRDAQATCVNCTGNDPPPAVDCDLGPEGMVVVIGRSGDERRCGLPLVARGALVEVYGSI